MREGDEGASPSKKSVSVTPKEPLSPTPDHELSYLHTKYPHLRDLAETPLAEDTKDSKEHISKVYEGSLVPFMGAELAHLSLHPLSPRMDEYWKGLGVDKKEQYSLFVTALNHVRKDHPSTGCFKLFFDIDRTRINIATDILLGALYLYEAMKEKEGTSLVLIGRSPCILGEAFKVIQRKLGDRGIKVINLNYSGHPDIETERANLFHTTEHDKVRARNMVTPTKFRHMCAYLSALGFDKIKDTLYAVDIVGSGCGLYAFEKLLDEYYASATLKRPKTHFFCLSANLHDASVAHSKRVFTLEKGATSNAFKFRFIPNLEKNIKARVLDTSYVLFSPLTIWRIFDYSYIQDLLVKGISYSAQKWIPAYDVERDMGAKNLFKEYYGCLASGFETMLNLLLPLVSSSSE